MESTKSNNNNHNGLSSSSGGGGSGATGEMVRLLEKEAKEAFKRLEQFSGVEETTLRHDRDALLALLDTIERDVKRANVEHLTLSDTKDAKSQADVIASLQKKRSQLTTDRNQMQTQTTELLSLFQQQKAYLLSQHDT